MTARILIVDDHELLREGVKSLLAKLRPEWLICGESNRADEVIELAQSLKPDIITMDITMPGMSGLEATSRMRKLGITIPVVIFTTHESERLGTEVRQAGAQGYVLKTQAARDLVLAMDTILAGGTFFGAPTLPNTSEPNKPTIPGILCLDLAFAL
jgi:DNA-binding NarL/FixJ family response regulator